MLADILTFHPVMVMSVWRKATLQKPKSYPWLQNVESRNQPVASHWLCPFLYTVHGNHVAVAVKLAFYPLKPKS